MSEREKWGQDKRHDVVRYSNGTVSGGDAYRNGCWVKDAVYHKFLPFSTQNAVPAGSGTAFFERLRQDHRLRRWS